MKRGLAAIIIALVLGAPVAALAYTNPGNPQGFVNDFAGVLSSSEKSSLESKLSDFDSKTGNEIAVATIQSLDGDTVENFAVKLFQDWSIGKKGKDNGVLLLVAVQDRNVRIEVGYGLEGVLTDAQSYWIIQNIMLPAFRDGKFYDGINGAVDKVIAVTQGETIPGASTTSSTPNVNIDWFWFILVLPVWLASILGRSKSWWAGGVIGGIVGVILGFIYGFLYFGIISIVLLIPLGLLFDYFVSKSYAKAKSSGRMPPWWIGGGWGGRGGGGGGGFGGFGGGRSGGGGSSGSW